MTVLARVRRTAVVLLALLLGAPVAAAAEDVLQRIAASRRVVVGARDGAVPMSYVLADGRHVGFHVDLCARIVEELRRRLEVPELRTAWVPSTAGTRLALLDNRTIDMDCGPNAISPELLQRAEPSRVTLAFDVAVMAKADGPVRTAADLDDRTVALVVGDVAVPRLREFARDRRLRVREVFGRDHAEALALLAAGRADAVAGPLPLMAAQRALAEDPAQYAMRDIVLGQVQLGLLFRAGDHALRDVADDVIAKLCRTGELARLYDTWYRRPIPGMPGPIDVPVAEEARERCGIGHGLPPP